jgi:hypothetical protein
MQEVLNHVKIQGRAQDVSCILGYDFFCYPNQMPSIIILRRTGVPLKARERIHSSPQSPNRFYSSSNHPASAYQGSFLSWGAKAVGE